MLEKDKLDTYLITINDGSGDDLGVELISFVKNPAIMVKGFAFNQEVKPLSFSTDDVKMRIIAPALIPMDIYRFDKEDNYEYQVQFTIEVIEQLRNKLMSKLNNSNIFNLEHTDVMVPAFIIETWIETSKFSRAKEEFGIDVPVGTLMVMSQITDRDYYDSLIKNEQFAYSVEGMFGIKELKLMIEKQKLEDAEIHPNCKCEIIDGELISNIDACDYCKEFELKIKEQKMEKNKLVGEFELDGKKYIFSDGEVTEKEEEPKEEELAEDKPEDEPKEEELEVVPVAPEDESVAEAIDEAKIIEILDAKLEEVYKMIADLTAKVDGSEVEDEAPVEEVQLSLVERFNSMVEYQKKYKK